MHRRLPPRPNVEFYRKQAKALLRAYRENKESAKLRVRSWRGESERGELRRRGRRPPALNLSEAQRIVAVESGFTSWPALKAAILEATVSTVSTGESDVRDRAATSRPAEALEQLREKKPQPKQRFEGDPNVRRWLTAHSARQDEGLASSYLAGHREREWINSSLQAFFAKGLIDDVVGVVKAGKEATVYRCLAAGGTGYVAAKIYRPRMFRNLQNDAVYRENRMPGRDRRSRKAMDSMSRRGRAFRMESWIRFEFDTLKRLYEAGVDVPVPLDTFGNAILMEFIGDKETPAPTLRHTTLDRGLARPLFERLIENVGLMLANDRVHADLSEYNVLCWQGKATIIDFAQAVDARSGADCFALLQRDVDHLAAHFSRFGVASEPAAIARDMWDHYSRGELRFAEGSFRSP